MLYLDFSKAFDSVDHDILLHKLQKHGINGVLLRWFESYLNDRWQRVVIEDAASSDVRCTPRKHSGTAAFYHVYQ